MSENAFRQLPSVDALLQKTHELETEFGRGRLLTAVRQSLSGARLAIGRGEPAPSEAMLLVQVHSLLGRIRHPGRVINATGVILHTNLGRAPLSEDAQQAMIEAAAGYSDLEYDLETGSRGKRESHLEALLTELTGAEAALAVNNNAAATVLALSALAQDREVIVSRGQLVEIGGGFRVPEVMAESGARLVEVGTTNRTRIADLERALSERTALLMRVHSSNFKMIGFTEQPSLTQIAELAHARGIAALDDLGSGALLDTAPFGLAHEPTVGESITSGFDLVTFSGDKLLGGPQAGIIVGKRALVATIKRHPLARAVRIDKLCLAALTATLDHYRYNEALQKIPVWKMIALSTEAIRIRAEKWVGEVGGEVVPARSTVGGGSLPGETLPSFALALRIAMPDRAMDVLRSASTPVIARIAEGQILFDPRTVFESQDGTLLESIRGMLAEHVS